MESWELNKGLAAEKLMNCTMVSRITTEFSSPPPTNHAWISLAQWLNLCFLLWLGVCGNRQVNNTYYLVFSLFRLEFWQYSRYFFFFFFEIRYSIHFARILFPSSIRSCIPYDFFVSIRNGFSKVLYPNSTISFSLFFLTSGLLS